MPLYQPSKLEVDIAAVNRASEMAASCLGIANSQREGGDLKLPDIRFEGAQKRAELGFNVLRLIDSVDEDTLPHQLALTSKLLRHFASAWSKDADRYWLAIDVTGALFYGPFAQTAYTGGFIYNAIAGVLAGFSFRRDGDGERYLALLCDVAHMTWQIHTRTEGQAQRGIRIHKLQLPAVRQLLQATRASAAVAYPVSAERLSQIPNADVVHAEIQRRIDQTVLPAFDALLTQLDEEYERKAPDGVGMDKLPAGREVYADLVRMHTTLDLTPEQVHAAGHSRMARIQAEMAKVRSQLGFSGSEADFAVYLRQQPGAVAKSPDDIGEKMRRHKDRIEKRFDEYFAQRASAEFELLRLPQALEGSMTWGFYSPPTGAEKRGIYFYNGSKLDSQAVIAAASLVFHELVPGHHLHLDLQLNNPHLSAFRRTALVNAFNEGWAEYAAMLAGEMGLYDDPYDWYGRLSQDAFLTCRLVVDSGMNALGWSWEQAKQYMREHTMCAEGEIESDTLRYACGIPAQSLAYKLGDEEILRMRGDIQGRLKDRFSFPDFHSAVLGCGAMPLPVLEWHLRKVFPSDAAA